MERDQLGTLESSEVRVQLLACISEFLLIKLWLEIQVGSLAKDSLKVYNLHKVPLTLDGARIKQDTATTKMYLYLL